MSFSRLTSALSSRDFRCCAFKAARSADTSLPGFRLEPVDEDGQDFAYSDSAAIRS